MPEALAELGIGPAQSLLRIHFHEARQIHQHKQQIAQLIFDLLLRSALAGFAELRPLFIQLRENLGDIPPVEANPRRPRSNLLRFDQRRQCPRNGSQQALRSLRLQFSALPL